MTTSSAAENLTPFDLIGGEECVARFVNRFYDLMDSDPAYAGLRSLHAADLGPMRASLTDFLIAWLGGPRHWFDQRPGACILSAHAKFPISQDIAAQWTGAMARALADSSIEPGLAEKINDAFGHMSGAMVNQARTTATPSAS